MLEIDNQNIKLLQQIFNSSFESEQELLSKMYFFKSFAELKLDVQKKQVDELLKYKEAMRFTELRCTFNNENTYSLDFKVLGNEVKEFLNAKLLFELHTDSIMFHCIDIMSQSESNSYSMINGSIAIVPGEQYLYLEGMVVFALSELDNSILQTVNQIININKLDDKYCQITD